MQTLKLKSLAPTRIDLCGGTVDIWPIYLLLAKPITINLGISLFAETVLEETASSNQVVLESVDQNQSLSFRWSEIAKLTPPPSLELHWKLLKHFLEVRTESQSHNPGIGMRISTKALSPAGAGLGGSSALSVSLVGCLATWAYGKGVDFVRNGERFIEIVKDIETTVIKVPAGLQDYYGAMFGGLQKLEWQVGAHQRQWLSGDLLEPLKKRLFLFYSGQSRNSGINNWVLFKDFIDGKKEVREKFEQIAASTLDLFNALKSENWNAVGLAIAKEWQTRRTLASGISTDTMEKAFALGARHGVSAHKVCGAGGGGCFFLYFAEPPEEKTLRTITDAYQELGIKPLPFSIVPHGLDVIMNEDRGGS